MLDLGCTAWLITVATVEGRYQADEDIDYRLQHAVEEMIGAGCWSLWKSDIISKHAQKVPGIEQDFLSTLMHYECKMRTTKGQPRF